MRANAAARVKHGAEFLGTGARLVPDDIAAAAARLGCEQAALEALLSVDCARSGFGLRGRVMAIFLPRRFSALTEGRFDRAHPEVSSSSYRFQAWAPGPDGVFQQIEIAQGLDEGAALHAALWGFPRISGADHAAAGFESAAHMVEAFRSGEAAQLEALTNLLISRGLQGALRAQDWAALRTWPAAPKGRPKARLRAYHRAYAAAAGAPPRKILRQGARGALIGAVQARLCAQGYHTAEDGEFGPRTEAALQGFQAENELPEDGVIGARTWDALDQPPPQPSAPPPDEAPRNPGFSSHKLAAIRSKWITTRRLAALAAMLLAGLEAAGRSFWGLSPIAHTPPEALILAAAAFAGAAAWRRWWPLRAA